MSEASPVARFWPSSARGRWRSSALTVVVALMIGLALLAPLVAPQDPYDLANSPAVRRAPSAGLCRLGRLYPLARHRRAGPRPALRHPLRPAHLPADGARGRRASPSPSASRSASARPMPAGARKPSSCAVIDLQLAFPAILLALVLSAMLRAGQATSSSRRSPPRNTPISPRTAHGAASAERGKDYVEAALSTPLPPMRVVWRHILSRTALPPLIVVATVQVASAIALEATLSFLGVGLPVDRALARHADRRTASSTCCRAATGSRSIPASR